MTLEEKKQRARDRVKAWRKANPEKRKAQSKKYREDLKQDPERLIKIKEVTKKRRENYTDEQVQRLKEQNYNSRIKHRDTRIEDSKRWRLNNPEKQASSTKRWTENNKQHVKIRKKEYNSREEVKARAREINAERYKNDPQYVMSRRLRARVNALLKGQKSSSTQELLGCTFEDFTKHIEDQFVDGMHWDNRSLWNIDHIRPCASFDLTDPEQQKECFHYSNMRPLWAEENKAKNSVWEGKRYFYNA